MNQINIGYIGDSNVTRANKSDVFSYLKQDVSLYRVPGGTPGELDKFIL